ncbi:hypothetical protein SERLADRAFT_443760 [Serpula lacrymans var. lacrymans S7.9]|uniref:Uncharacterized protein n=1 Tax=Serpula lacrymans var. lacrymans (strain S7.9) TaxID=578457 RepID=F8PDG8_SERL9|nr:uncharacterized protein SERLADRAFT_443760 [Serpula lacrymans var. lacrymans S7.9]EGO18789.1 hypothetical protein SERLADRAFT_443760 [Serpula lacrymans var. lacrymans S7.9]
MAEEEERRGKVRKEEEAKALKAVKMAEYQAQMARPNGTKVFTGALGSKAKTDLQLIAAAPSLSVNGKKQEVLDSIKDHFEAHPDLERNACFAGLFGTRARRQAAAPPSAPTTSFSLPSGSGISMPVVVSITAPQELSPFVLA